MRQGAVEWGWKGGAQRNDRAMAGPPCVARRYCWKIPTLMNHMRPIATARGMDRFVTRVALRSQSHKGSLRPAGFQSRGRRKLDVRRRERRTGMEPPTKTSRKVNPNPSRSGAFALRLRGSPQASHDALRVLLAQPT